MRMTDITISSVRKERPCQRTMWEDLSIRLTRPASHANLSDKRDYGIARIIGHVAPKLRIDVA